MAGYRTSKLICPMQLPVFALPVAHALVFDQLVVARVALLAQWAPIPRSQVTVGIVGHYSPSNALATILSSSSGVPSWLYVLVSTCVGKLPKRPVL